MATLTGSVGIHVATSDTAVAMAADDLRQDLHAVLDEAPHDAAASDATIVIDTDAQLGIEAWRITATGEQINITGGDVLGTTYGIYRFAERILGIDPLYFWKDIAPAPRKEVIVASQVIESSKPTFRFRGWFINDEDLLSEWRLDGGARHIDYAFYDKVVHTSIIDRVCEALLRMGGNMMIPASFIDVMNPPEAGLVAHCVKRGLYVTQHHIEPLGVSHFGFENYWRARGEERRFDYFAEPDKVRQCWREFAAKWWAIAGEQVIWQFGLRGRGDVPVWNNVAGIDRHNAGQYISQALAEQWDIVNQLDSRDIPPATTTLWMEGSALMAEGSLRIPDNVAIIFADEGLSQMMQADFDRAPRQPGVDYGVYYHCAFWSRGPHLAQGTRPRKLHGEFSRIVDRGDTHYAIVNVSNIREFVLGVEACMACMNDYPAYDPAAHIDRFAGPELAPLYREYLDSLIDASDDVITQDAALWVTIERLVRDIGQGETDEPWDHYRQRLRVDKPEAFGGRLDEAIAGFDRIVQRFDALGLTEAGRGFYEVNLRLQSIVMREYCRCVQAMRRALVDRSALAEAEAALRVVLDERRIAERGKWRQWYRGDRKENVPRMIDTIGQLQEQPA